MVRIFFPSKQSYKPLQELYPRYYQIGPYSCSWAGAPAHWALYGPFDPLVHFTGPVGIHVTAPRDRHDSYHSIPSAAARRPHGITQKAKQQLRREDATRNHLHHPDTPGRPAASQPTNATRPPLQCAQASKLVVET